MSVDDFLDRTYHKTKYNCMHFAADVYRELTGRDIGGLATPPKRCNLKRIKEPVSPCVVLFMARAPHIGIYFKGRVLHLTEQGASFHSLEVASLGFNTIQFYA